MLFFWAVFVQSVEQMCVMLLRDTFAWKSCEMQRYNQERLLLFSGTLQTWLDRKQCFFPSDLEMREFLHLLVIRGTEHQHKSCPYSSGLWINSISIWPIQEEQRSVHKSNVHRLVLFSSFKQLSISWTASDSNQLQTDMTPFWKTAEDRPGLVVTLFGFFYFLVNLWPFATIFCYRGTD